MPNEAKEHLHKYERRILGGRRVVYYFDEILQKRKRKLEKTGGWEVFACTLPGCTHFVPYERAIGRIGQCWNCGSELVLDKDNLKLKKPTHKECRRIRVAI